MSTDFKFTEQTPPTRKRAGSLSEIEAQTVMELFHTITWVGPKAIYGSRASATYQAKRLIKYLNRLEPGSTFTSKTWTENHKWRWAVRRAPNKETT